MIKNGFERFAPFIQEYIYKEKWQELHQTQIEASDVIFNTNNDVLIATPTASGKTESALFPITTMMYEEPVKGIAALYVSPLKALINDQFNRFETILENAKINVFRWHGDVSSHQKKKALNTNNIILQITPESLESLFLHHFEELSFLFNRLKFIIIDEVHYFLGSRRGIQLISLLERLEKIINRRVRKIGLSATIGNLEEASTFFSSQKNIYIITSRQEKTKIRLYMMYDIIRNEQDEIKFYFDVYKLMNQKKCIVFANSKKQVETTAQHLKDFNEQTKGKNYILVHHGNISKSLRDEVETKMKNEDGPITAVATMTLELGIDLGHLERVIQIDVPLQLVVLFKG